MQTHSTNGPLMSPHDSKSHNEEAQDDREWDDLLRELTTLDDPDDVSVAARDGSNRLQMNYGCYRVLKCKGAE